MHDDKTYLSMTFGPDSLPSQQFETTNTVRGWTPCLHFSSVLRRAEADLVVCVNSIEHSTCSKPRPQGFLHAGAFRLKPGQSAWRPGRRLSLDITPIRGLRWLRCCLTREFTASLVRCRLRKPPNLTQGNPRAEMNGLGS